MRKQIVAVVATVVALASVVTACGSKEAMFKVWGDQVTAAPTTYGSSTLDVVSGWKSFPMTEKLPVTDDSAGFRIEVESHMSGVVHCSITVGGHTATGTSSGQPYMDCVAQTSANQ